MPITGRSLDTARLPPQVRNRFVECLAGRHSPRPLWSMTASPKTAWAASIAAGMVLLGIAAVASGTSVQSWAWIACWFLGFGALVVGISGWARSRRTRKAAIPPGAYLFASDLVVMAGRECLLYDLESAVDIRARTTPGANVCQLEMIYHGGVARIEIDGIAPTRSIVTRLNQDRITLIEGAAAGIWDRVAQMDPLYEARYGGAWDQIALPTIMPNQIRPAATGPAVSAKDLSLGLLAAGVLAFPGWWGANYARDEIAFKRAHSANTVAMWTGYLKRGNERHMDEVQASYLPAAEVKAALASGSYEDLRAILNKYREIGATEPARIALALAFARARKKVQEECGPAAKQGFAELFAWLEENGTGEVEVRFGAGSEHYLADLDSYLDLVRDDPISRRVEFPRISPAFSNAATRMREERIIQFLRQGFRRIAEGDLVMLRRGGTFSGDPLGFERPAIAIQVVAKPHETRRPVVFDEDEKVYISLVCVGQVHLVVPGKRPHATAFRVDFADGVPRMGGGRNAYVRMADYAYEEVQQGIVTEFLPGLPFQRAERLVARTSTAPVEEAAYYASGTGFVISKAGYIVTAAHVVAGGGKIDVFARSGKLSATVLKAFPEEDLAILKVSENLSRALPVRNSAEIKMGETVATVGFPNIQIQGETPKVTRGEINGDMVREGLKLYQISAPIQPGNSGGALVDVRGNVVGVVVSQLKPGMAQNVNYAVPSEKLVELLRTNLPDLSLEPAVGGAVLEFTEVVQGVTEGSVLLKVRR